MRQLTILLLSLLLFSCSQSPIEKLVSDYEQNIDGTITDLNLKIKEVKDIGFVTAIDSAKFYEEKFKVESKGMIDATEVYIETLNKEIDQYKKAINDPVLSIMKSDYKKSLKEYQEKLKKETKTLAQYRNGDFSGTIYKDLQVKAANFKKLGDKKLVIFYECTYSIKNPFLNNAKQTLTKIYHIDSNLTNIIQAKKKVMH